MALDTFRNHQTAISTLLKSARECLSKPEPLRTKELAAIRWRLMRSLRSYQLFKHIEVFDRLLLSDDVERVALARDMKARCIEVGSLYEAHVKRWSLASVDTGWSDYENETRKVLSDLYKHLEREMKDAMTLLIGLSRTRSIGVKNPHRLST